MRLRHWIFGSALAAMLAIALFGLNFPAVLGALWAASAAAAVTMCSRAAKVAAIAYSAN
jgi:hypothetical protein